MRWFMAARSIRASTSCPSRSRSTSSLPRYAACSTRELVDGDCAIVLLGIVVVGENALQRFPLDRLLQYRNAAEACVDTVGIIPGDEHERHAAPRQNLGDGID